MERRRKYSRHLFHTLHTLLPPVLRVTQISLVVFCSLFLLVDYAEGIMTFPDERGVYSLFPDEDLKTGRKRFRFDEETTRSYRDREGREYSHIVRSYPMLPQDRLHRPVDFSGGGSSRQVYDSYRDRDRERERDRSRERDRDRSRERERDRDRSRERQGRVYFDDRFRTSRFEFHRLTPRPRPIDRPVSPILFETSRRPPNHHNRFFHDDFPPPPAVGQSKLPPGASTRASSEDPVPPTRIHVFNPDSVNFGNPRHAGGGESSREETSAERVKNPPSNFVETGPPGPESFLNHEEFLEYQKKIAFSRFHEQDANSGPPGGNRGNNGKKVLFESKEPFEIDGLEPPERSRENPGKSPTTIGSPLDPNQGQSSSSSQRFNHQLYDQRQHQRHGEGQQGRGNGPPSHHHHHNHHPNPDDNGGGGGEGDTEGGGGEVESDIVNGKGEEVESENGKSEVRLPPTHIPKSGRALNSGSSGNSVGEGINSKKITPSISYNENVGGGTGFKLPLPTTAVLSYSGGGDRDHDEPPNLNGFVPVVPFHLIGPEQPRAISLERQRIQQQHHIVPHHHHEPHEYSTTARSTTTPSTTVRSIPVPTTIASTTTTHRVKAAKSGFTGFIPTPEVTKFSSSSSSSSTSSFSKFSVENAGNGNNGGGGGDIGIVVSAGIGGSPASPILHATAGERSNSETHSKVAITKQQELKRLQKQRQQLTTHSDQHQLTNSNPPNAEPPPSHSSSDGLFPQISGLGDTSSSADSADNSGHTPGTLTNMPNSYILDVDDDDDDTSSHKEDITPSTLFIPTASPPPTSSASSEHDFNMNSHHHTNILEQSPFQLHTISSTSTSSKNMKHNRTLLHVKDDETELNKLSSTSSGGEKISTLLDSENNEIFDTQPIKTANGIRQGEFHLEGYMISGDGGDGRSLNSRSNSVSSSSGSSSADYSNNNEENIVENQPNYPHRSLYDYPEEHEEHLPIVGVGVNNDVSFGTTSPIKPEVNQNDISHDNNALSHNNHRGGGDDDGIVISQFPGTTVTPDLGDLTPLRKNTTPYHEIQPTGSASQEGTSRNDDETRVTGNDYFSTNTDPSSRSDGAGAFDGSLVVDDLAFDSEPAPPPELRRTRFSENDDDNSYAGLGPTSPYPNENSIEQDEPVGVYPYYGQFGNKINVTESKLSKSSGISSSIPSSGFISDDNDHDVGGGEFHEDGNDSFDVLDLHGKSFDLDGNPDKRIGSASINSGEMSRLKSSNGISDIIPFDDNDNPSFISIPVEATLNTGLAPPAPYFSSNSVENSHSKKDLEESFVAGANGEDSGDESNNRFDNSPLYLESSETLINKTYYLDGNSLSSKSHKHYNGSMKDAIINSLKSSNFIKVTRIKGGLTPSSKETVEKTSAAILASSKRPAKPAVIVSATGAGLRPRVVGSVVEAGPAWPGLVSNFIRTNNPGPPPGYNRTFTATATVRPRGNSGTNPTHPTMVISGQVQKVTLTPVPTAAQQRQLQRLQKEQAEQTQFQRQQKEQAEQTQFQLQQIRHPTLTTNIGNTNRPSNARSSAPPPPTQSQSRTTKASASNKSHQHNYITNSTVISSVINSGGGPSLVKQVSSKLITNDNNKNNINIPPPPPPPPTNATDGGQAHIVTRRLYSSEEDSSSAQIKSNSSSGVVSLVHAHISHCPKLLSPTEVICDVHIREGHGVPNPQLTVGWRRKYYNATTPDVLLTLNKAPASGEGGHFDPHHSVMEVEPGKEGERLEEFHDKFNVTLAPGISPMLRSVLLIRSVAPPDCGTYQCEVSDGVNVLTSETLLFLCH